MAVTPLELKLELKPRSRFDAIDVRDRVSSLYGNVLEAYPRCLYCSFHTTAGFFEQGLVSRLKRQEASVSGFMEPFRTVFPEGAPYRHDDLRERVELSEAQRKVEPRNADSHLAFMASGLRNCVTYVNRPGNSVPFVDLDGVYAGQPRRRQASVVGYFGEAEVERIEVGVPVSSHPIDSINLRDPELGLYERVAELVRRHGVTKGRLRIDLAPGERHAGLTVNEYETLLMRHDLREVLRDPLRFMAEKSRHALRDPRAIPTKTLGYATYDLVQALNQLVDALGLKESLIERLLARAMAVPAERFLRMKRSVSLLVSDYGTPGMGGIVEGTYQSPILVQWHRTSRHARQIVLTLSSFS
jgi:thiamine phosphate synthase YjbQ (UPF0047 family)